MNSYIALLAAGVILAIVALVVSVSMLVRRSQRRRSEDLQSAAYSLGYEFDETDPSLLEGELGQLPFFERGRRARVRNIVRRSTSGREVRLFDYSYTTGGGQHSTTHRQSVVALHEQERSLPAFEMRPEHVFHKMGAMLGFQDLDFDDSPEFSKHYLLRGADESAIRSLFGSSIRQRLAEDRGWSIEAKGGWLVLTRHGKTVKPVDAIGFLEECVALEAVLLGRH